MESAILTGKSKKDIQLLVAIAEKMGIEAKFLSKDEMEDFGIGRAIIEGRTNELVDADEFLGSLK